MGGNPFTPPPRVDSRLGLIRDQGRKHRMVGGPEELFRRGWIDLLGCFFAIQRCKQGSIPVFIKQHEVDIAGDGHLLQVAQRFADIPAILQNRADGCPKMQAF
ncbi:hypothetical protein D3C81_1819770 [compost metagenome]